MDRSVLLEMSHPTHQVGTKFWTLELLMGMVRALGTIWKPLNLVSTWYLMSHGHGMFRKTEYTGMTPTINSAWKLGPRVGTTTYKNWDIDYKSYMGISKNSLAVPKSSPSGFKSRSHEKWRLDDSHCGFPNRCQTEKLSGKHLNWSRHKDRIVK